MDINVGIFMGGLQHWDNQEKGFKDEGVRNGSIEGFCPLLDLCGHTTPKAPQIHIMTNQSTKLPQGTEIFPLQNFYMGEVYFRNMSSDVRKITHDFSNNLEWV